MYLNSLLMYGNSKNRFSTYNKTPILQKPICYRRVQLLVLRHISVSFHFSTCVFLGFGLFKKTKRKKVGTRYPSKGQTKSKWFFKPTFLPKTNKQIRLYYYDTSGRLVFVCFLEEIEDTKKTFRN